MNPTVKAKWVAALRSGEYTQSTGRLKTEGGFCCLGVLCDLHHKETNSPGWKQPHTDQGSTSYQYYASPRTTDLSSYGTSLPQDVRDWADLPSSSPVVTYKNGSEELASLNDGSDELPSLTFTEIADLIEEQL